FQHVASLVVERIEDVALDALGPTRILENFPGRANVNIEVDERAAADAARLQHVDVFESAIVEQAEIFVIPERARNLARGARKIFFAPTLATLEDANRSARLGEPASIDRSAEAGSDNNDVVDVFHGIG